MNKVIQLNSKDNVAVALHHITSGTKINLNGTEIVLKNDIPKGHKFSLKHMQIGDEVIKYGSPIGHAIQQILIGEHVHSHNLKTGLNDINSYHYNKKTINVVNTIPDHDILLYRRNNGDVAIRNDIWIIPTVGCVNGIAEQIKRTFLQTHMTLSNVDSVHVLSHPYGCSQLGEDHNNTKIILQDMVHHPHAGGVLIIGLGCENNQLAPFKESLGKFDDNRVKFMVSQNYDDEIATGVDFLNEIYSFVSKDKREKGKLSELKFGLECGGSDGFSGITANPMLGNFSDYVIANGGTSVLTEVPEMFGAEHILMNHCKNEETFQKTVAMINNFKQYFKSYNQPIYENPSPGNKDGGITTLEDKSLGCTQKAGQSQIVDVLKYGDRLVHKGLNLLSAPGNDAVATSALIASGCHMVLFSTGRGTPYGGMVPTVKIATNSELAQRKKNWIDFNAGQLIEGVTMQEMLIQFIDLIVEISNGKNTRNEINQFNELAIFKQGVTL